MAAPSETRAASAGPLPSLSLSAADGADDVGVARDGDGEAPDVVVAPADRAQLIVVTVKVVHAWWCAARPRGPSCGHCAIGPRLPGPPERTPSAPKNLAHSDRPIHWRMA